MVRSSNTRSLSTRPARRRDARRGEILRAASRIFRDRGFADTGMRDIAEAADLSPANLYHYFRGKDEILYLLPGPRARPDAGRRRRGEARQPASGGPARLDPDAHTCARCSTTWKARRRISKSARSPPALRTRLIHKRDRYEHAVRRLVADGIASGEFARLDPAVVTRAMLGALNWTVTWFRPGGAATAGDVAATIAGYLVRGITNGRH